MNKIQVETRVGNQVARVLDGHQIEDDYVECKGEWYTDHKKAARQIAGLCNAARGEDAMWIVGIDEDAHALRALPTTEHSTWWAQVKKWFADDVAPEVDTIVVGVPGGSVVALVFTTDRAPYAVTVANHRVSREIPWRETNSTATATRSQLLSVLVPNLGTPELELINPEVVSIAVDDPDTLPDTLHFTADLFISAADRAMLPSHRWSLTISADEWDQEGWGPLRPTLHVQRIGIDEEGPGLRVLDHSGVYVNGPGRVRLSAGYDAQDAPWSLDHRRTLKHQGHLRIALDMPVDRHAHAAQARTTLTWVTTPTMGYLWRER